MKLCFGRHVPGRIVWSVEHDHLTSFGSSQRFYRAKHACIDRKVWRAQCDHTWDSPSQPDCSKHEGVKRLAQDHFIAWVKKRTESRGEALLRACRHDDVSGGPIGRVTPRVKGSDGFAQLQQTRLRRVLVLSGLAFGHRVSAPKYKDSIGMEIGLEEIEPGHWVSNCPCCVER